MTAWFLWHIDQHGHGWMFIPSMAEVLVTHIAGSVECSYLSCACIDSGEWFISGWLVGPSMGICWRYPTGTSRDTCSHGFAKVFGVL